MTYISGLKDLLELKKAHPEYKMILHSDQGSVYASKAYNELLPMYVNRALERLRTTLQWNPLMVGLKLSCLWISM